MFGTHDKAYDALDLVWEIRHMYVPPRHNQQSFNKVWCFQPTSKNIFCICFGSSSPISGVSTKKKGLKKSTTVADQLSLKPKPSKQLFKDMSSTTLQVTLVQVRPGTSDGWRVSEDSWGLGSLFKKQVYITLYTCRYDIIFYVLRTYHMIWYYIFSRTIVKKCLKRGDASLIF